MDRHMIDELAILRRRAVQRFRVAGRTDEGDDIVRALARLGDALDTAQALATSAEAFLRKEMTDG